MSGPQTYVGRWSELEAMPFTPPFEPVEAWASGVTIHNTDGTVHGLLIATPAGTRVAPVGDYIIRTPFFTDHFPPDYFETHYRLFVDPTPQSQAEVTTPKDVYA